MDRYTARINLHGTTQRERIKNRLKTDLKNKLTDSLSYKTVMLNDTETQLVINSGTKSYCKEFQSLPGQDIKMGDYIQWSDRTWLVYEADADGEIYIDGKMYECNYQLHWQNSDGDVVSKWAFIQNARSYNNGEEENKVLTLASNQFMVWMPIDEDTIALRNGKRMFADNYSDAPSCYKVTRPDNVSMKFGEKGCTYYIFTQTETNTEKDKLIVLDDGKEVWICDYSPPVHSDRKEEENTGLSSNIIGSISGKSYLKTGFPRTYTIHFTNEDGELVDEKGIAVSWNVVSNFHVEKAVNDNRVELLVSDENCIGKTITLQAIGGDHHIYDQIVINIMEGF